ncbi:TrmH family RNA methyltransferase [Thermocoleostomius sinensis]|uniref:RNA methyltransferase n=1 Tax=Thermocoleostomius sinensis A174 TaxID=2016057 RepID=A0A9E8ZF55_9CYAN|nr:RNA methyltransferase [Thermocoleostomius sinensis]WAL60075.1 RNA methyltransferase [Thermocoleostomius sinensis A174]
MITSLQNPLVKQLRKLQRAKERRNQRLMLLEGTHLVEEACAAGMPLVTACHTTAWQQTYPQLWSVLMQRAIRVELVSEEVLQAIATTVHPDGVVATAERTLGSAQFMSPTRAVQLGVALETIQDPGNLGAVIRTAAAVGVDGLWLSVNSVDLDHPKVLRASAGQWFRLPMTVSGDLSRDLQMLKLQGVQLVATVPTATLTYWQVDFTRPTVVLLGNEGGGLSSALLTLSDVAVKIPLAAGIESLNVAIAAALVLYEARRQQSFTEVLPR